MGERSSSKATTKKKRYSRETSSSSSPSSSSYSEEEEEEEEQLSSKRHRRSSSRRRREEDRHRIRRRSRERSSSSRRGDKEKRRKKKNKRDNREKRRGSRRGSSKTRYDSDESGSSSDGSPDDPVGVVRDLLKEFPSAPDALELLLRRIDDGQAVDITGLSDRSLVKHLRKLFLSLNLKESDHLVFLLPSDARPTLERVGAFIRLDAEPQIQIHDHDVPQNGKLPVPPVEEDVELNYDANVPALQEDASTTKRRVIGPEMPSAELLAAAAKLTEAEAELRDAEMDEDSSLFIGPPPPALVKEAESANEAERFEEVTRIMGAEVDNPYDIVGVNRKMPADNIKKRYWKLSLLVHPDKNSHPQANQAFIKLNKAFKDLQDPDKRKAMDEKIDQKEEQERFKLELKALREAAQWRRLQGISMEGDDILLAELDAKEEPRRDEWMTTLPPERKPGVVSQSTTRFSKNSKEGRGDTSVWTDTPSDRAQKAKMNYLEAYNEAAALASNDQEKKISNADAELVDKYNKAKRSKSLVEKHQEASRSRSKKKSKQDQEQVKEAWEGQHPWKPWDREKDLTAGRQKVKLDAENMAQGLTSRFSSGSFQRNFL